MEELIIGHYRSATSGYTSGIAHVRDTLSQMTRAFELNLQALSLLALLVGMFLFIIQ